MTLKFRLLDECRNCGSSKDGHHHGLILPCRPSNPLMNHCVKFQWKTVHNSNEKQNYEVFILGTVFVPVRVLENPEELAPRLQVIHTELGLLQPKPFPLIQSGIRDVKNKIRDLIVEVEGK